jgi:hypothetical protein
MPEKSGIDAVPWLTLCTDAGDENRAAVVAIMTIRMMDFSSQALRRAPACAPRLSPLIRKRSAPPAGSSRLKATPISRAFGGGGDVSCWPISEVAVAGGRLSVLWHQGHTYAQAPERSRTSARSAAAQAASGESACSAPSRCSGRCGGVGGDAGAETPAGTGRLRLGPGNRALSSGKRDGGAAIRIYNQRSTGNMTKKLFTGLFVPLQISRISWGGLVASVAPDNSLPSAGASFATHRFMPQAEGRLAAVRGTLVDARCSGHRPRGLSHPGHVAC